MQGWSWDVDDEVIVSASLLSVHLWQPLSAMRVTEDFRSLPVSGMAQGPSGLFIHYHGMHCDVLPTGLCSSHVLCLTVKAL